MVSCVKFAISSETEHYWHLHLMYQLIWVSYGRLRAMTPVWIWSRHQKRGFNMLCWYFLAKFKNNYFIEGRLSMVFGFLRVNWDGNTCFSYTLYLSFFFSLMLQHEVKKNRNTFCGTRSIHIERWHLMLSHSVPYFPLNVRGIVCWVLEFYVALLPW